MENLPPVLFGSLTLLGLKRFFQGGKNHHFPDLTGKVIVITGANTGLGFISAEEMAKLNPKVIIFACRSRKRGEDAIAQIKSSNPSANLVFQQLDLSNLSSVKNFVENFEYDTVDILLNNAGMASPKRQETVQGLEMLFVVNHLGHFMLTKLLMPKILRAQQGRIVNLTSRAHEDGKMNFHDLQSTTYKTMDVYGQSKLANVYFTRELEKRFTKQGVKNVKSASVHPGVVRTEMWRHTSELVEGYPILPYIYMFFSYLVYPIIMFMTKSAWWGTQTQLHCCLCPFEELQSGKYYADCKVSTEKMPNDNWEQEATKLWEISEDLVKDYI